MTSVGRCLNIERCCIVFVCVWASVLWKWFLCEKVCWCGVFGVWLAFSSHCEGFWVVVTFFYFLDQITDVPPVDENLTSRAVHFECTESAREVHKSARCSARFFDDAHWGGMT